MDSAVAWGSVVCFGILFGLFRFAWVLHLIETKKERKKIATKKPLDDSKVFYDPWSQQDKLDNLDL